MVAPALITAGVHALSFLNKYKGAIGSAISSVGNNMGILSSIFGSKSSANSAQKSFEYSKALQEHQYQLDRQARRASFRDTRTSLESAGYNPLLAVDQQANGGSYGASLNVQDPETERLNNKMAEISAMVNVANQRSQAEVNSSQAQLNQQQKQLSVADYLLREKANSAQTAYTNAITRKQQLDNENYNLLTLDSARANIENMRSGSASNYASASRSYSDIALNNIERQVKNATIGQIRAITQSVNNQNSSMQAEADWNRKHPKQAGFLYGAQRYMNLFGSAMGGANSGASAYSSAKSANHSYRSSGKH